MKMSQRVDSAEDEAVEGAEVVTEFPLIGVEPFFDDWPLAKLFPFASLTSGFTSGLTPAFVVCAFVSNLGILAGDGTTVRFLNTKFFAGEGVEEEEVEKEEEGTLVEEELVAAVVSLLDGVGVFLVGVGVGVVFGVILDSTSIGSSSSPSSALGGEGASADLSTPSSA